MGLILFLVNIKLTSIKMKQTASLIATLLFGLSGADHVPGHPHAHPHHQPFHHGAAHHGAFHHAPAQHSHQSIHKDGLAIHTVGHTAHGGHASAHSGVAPIHHAGFHAGHHAPHHQAVHHPVHHQAVHHQAVHHQAVHHPEPVAQAYEPTEDVVDIAVGNPDFSTLVKIVSDLGLVETLKNAEAVTIFAPNDAAFAKLPAGTLESLTPEQAKEIVLRHVVGAKVSAQDVATGPVETLGGETIELVKHHNGGIQIKGPTTSTHVILANIFATNGVIHVIDSVIL